MLPAGTVDHTVVGKITACTNPIAECSIRDALRSDRIALVAKLCGCLGVDMGKGSVLSEFGQFLRQEKKYWLVPIVIMFILFGLLLVFSQSSAVAPFIYTLF